MSFFYDLNKRLAALADKQDAKQISEDARATAPKSKLAESMDVAEAGYSAKAARAGKDIGKPGKNFSKIAADAGKRYGSKAAGERVAGAVLNKLRHPTKEGEMDESLIDLAKEKYYSNKMINAHMKGDTGQGNDANDKRMAALYNRTGQFLPKDSRAYQTVQGREPLYKTGMSPNQHQDLLDRLTSKGLIKSPMVKKVTNEGHCPACDCSPCKCDTMEESALQADLDEVSRGEWIKQQDTKAEKSGKKKFNALGQTFNTDEIDEGFKEMDAWLAQREKEKGTGKFDRKERTLPGGMKATTYSRREEEPESDDDEEITTITIKKKGRPKSAAPKDSERVTKRSHKYKTVDGKRVKKEKTDENLDSDGVMMTRPTSCSSESIDRDMEGSHDRDEAGEYGAEGDYVKNELHTMIRVARDLEKHLRDNEDLPTWCIGKLSQAKGMVVSVMDYIISEKERGAEADTGEEGLTTVIPEKAVSKAQRKFMGMAHAIQKGEKIKGASPELKKVAKTMKSSDTHDFAATKEKGLPNKVKKTEEGAKPDFLDIDKDGDKKEPMKKAAKDKKEEKVDETTVSGSVATATTSGKSSSGGMQFGKGVYEGFNNQVESMITEGMNVTVNMNAGEDGQTHKSITVTAEGEEADQLAALLKMAGLHGQSSESCDSCGQAPCGCEQTVDEAYGDTDETLNNPDWPTDTETLAAQPELRTYSGGLNGPKSTGQTTVPVVASQLRRQASMEESVALERSLFKTWKNYKG